MSDKAYQNPRQNSDKQTAGDNEQDKGFGRVIMAYDRWTPQAPDCGRCCFRRVKPSDTLLADW